MGDEASAACSNSNMLVMILTYLALDHLSPESTNLHSHSHSPTVSMRLKSTFADPDKFDPDRYAAPREEHKTPYAYLGFGGGLHSCMGQNFAFVQVKTILSILFREYDIERVAPEMPSIGYDDMVVGPKGDCRVNYRKRVIS
jgi:sterol 14-demethylase